VFKLIYERQTSSRGWVKYEENFSSGEARTVVEIARDKLGQPNTFRNVRVLDERLVKGEVKTIQPLTEDEAAEGCEPIVLKSQTLKVPSLVWVDLGKLPRKPVARKETRPKTVKVLGVRVAGLEDLPACASTCVQV